MRLRISPITLGALRHTFFRRWVDSGADLAVLAAIVGWKSYGPVKKLLGAYRLYKVAARNQVKLEAQYLGAGMTSQVTTPVYTGVVPSYEFIDCKTLAQRWALPESWIREQVRSRTADPLPHIRFGKYVRFRWASPELSR